MQRNLAEYYKHVAIETTLFDIHSSKIHSSMGEDHTHDFWKFDWDSLSILWVTVKFVKSVWLWEILWKKVVLASGADHRRKMSTP